MSELEHIEAKYADAQEALSDLAQLSRMLEIARVAEARIECTHADLRKLIDKLVRDRRTALQAIDALTEAAPSLGGVEIAPQVGRAGDTLNVEVSAILQEAAAIIEQAGGL